MVVCNRMQLPPLCGHVLAKGAVQFLLCWPGIDFGWKEGQKNRQTGKKNVIVFLILSLCNKLEEIIKNMEKSIIH